MLKDKESKELLPQTTIPPQNKGHLQIKKTMSIAKLVYHHLLTYLQSMYLLIEEVLAMLIAAPH